MRMMMMMMMTTVSTRWISFLVLPLLLLVVTHPSNTLGFVTPLPVQQQQQQQQNGGASLLTAAAAKGFGAGSSSSGSGNGSNNKSKKVKKNKNRASTLQDALDDKPRIKKTTTTTTSSSKNMPFVKSDQEYMLEQLAKASANTVVGLAVASSPYAGTSEADPFWELMPSLLSSRFPSVKDDQLHRVAGMIRHAVHSTTTTATTTATQSSSALLLLEDSIVQDPYRPHDEIHAYMPGLGPTKPFYDPSEVSLCQRLSDNYDIIVQEYHALLKDSQNVKNRFQSVTSMNYDSGWNTLVLFYNGHRIPGFPYHLCPVTTELMESVPLAGRIAGFNRQQPQTGIPLHSDGNNMWLTCQMGIIVPDDNMASIRVGPETRHWKAGECLLYDTTYEHETMNRHPTQERVVLHIDFFNTIAMTPIEIEVMQYIYRLREEFMKAEGNAKVGAQIL